MIRGGGRVVGGDRRLAAQDEERAEEEAKRRRKDEEDKRTRKKRRQLEQEREARRRATETDVQKMLSPKNLPLGKRIGPTLDQCLQNEEMVYRPDEAKQREFEETLEKIHYHRKHIDVREQKKKEEAEGDGDDAQKELDLQNKQLDSEGEGGDTTRENLKDLKDLLMPDKLYSSYKNTLPRNNIEATYESVVNEAAKRRIDQAAEEERRRKSTEQLIHEAPAYTEPNEWEDDEENGESA